MSFEHQLTPFIYWLDRRIFIWVIFICFCFYMVMMIVLVITSRSCVCVGGGGHFFYMILISIDCKEIVCRSDVWGSVCCIFVFAATREWWLPWLTASCSMWRGACPLALPVRSLQWCHHTRPWCEVSSFSAATKKVWLSRNWWAQREKGGRGGGEREREIK